MSTHHARELVRNAVFTLAREAGAEMTERPVITGDPSWTQKEPEPLAAIRAAVALRSVVADVERQAAKHARQDGRTWAEIAGALGCEGDPGCGLTPGGQAFERMASDLGSGPTFAWTCPGCGQLVIERGPECGHPADCEAGHADGCARLAETVRAYDAQWEDEGDGSDG